MCIVICTLLLSRPARGAWVEIFCSFAAARIRYMSRPARGAWVEMCMGYGYIFNAFVAPRKGRVG